MSINCTIDLSKNLGQLTKRIMFGSIVNNLTSSLKNAGNDIKDLCLQNIRTHLYPGHGYLTGNLYNSYTGNVQTDSGSVKIRIWTDVHYAKYVEYGTYKMSPRAHFRPGLQETQKMIPEKMKSAINGVLG